MRITESYLSNIIMVNVSRTWERIVQENNAIPFDEIESVDSIIEIVDNIMRDQLIQKFLSTDVDYFSWEKETGTNDGLIGYIQSLAITKINSDILELNNISKDDYIIWDKVLNEPVDDLDIVYHHTTIVEMINDCELSLQDDEEFKCVASLPLKWQYKINMAIQNIK